MNEALPKANQTNLWKNLSVQPPFDEAALVIKASTDPTALAALYDVYFPRVHKYILYRVQDIQLTDDLVSQTFEKMLTGIGRFHPQQAPFKAWLFGIARHVIADHFRTFKHQLVPLIEQMSDHKPSSEELAIKSEQNLHLLSAMQILTDRERDLIGLKFAGGLKNRQIATLSNLSESNVGIILYRAIQRLRNELSQKESCNE